MSKQEKVDNSDHETAKRPGSKEENGVPGAHGEKEEFHNGQSGVSMVRGDYDEIQPSEDVGKDEIKKDKG